MVYVGRKCSVLSACACRIVFVGSVVFFIFIIDFICVSFAMQERQPEELLSSTKKNSNGICRRAVCQPVKL